MPEEHRDRVHLAIHQLVAVIVEGADHRPVQAVEIAEILAKFFSPANLEFCPLDSPRKRHLNAVPPVL